MCTDRGGCFEHRIALPLAHLGRIGHDTSFGNGVSASLLDELSARSDSVLIAKFVTDEADTAAWESIARSPKRPALMVYDVDDSYYHVSDIYTGDRSVYAKPETVPNSERVMRAADLITTTTPELASVYEHLGTPIAVLPNAVADEILDWQLRTPPKVFTVGYQGSPSHLYDMQYWVGAFDAFMDAAPRARWHWFGLHDPKCWPTHRQKVTPWINSAEQFHRSLNGRFHVGVAPLHPGRTGFLASTPAQWKDALIELYRDPGKAETMGMHARDLEATRVMSRVVHKWETAYREALCLK
jgi:hypothetical protein